jgi:hypothetical protein
MRENTVWTKKIYERNVVRLIVSLLLPVKVLAFKIAGLLETLLILH